MAATAVGISIFKWMPFATDLVCFGGKPAPVPEALIEGIRERILQLNATTGELVGALTPAGRGAGTQSPATGLETIFDLDIPGRARVRALLNIRDGITVSS